MQQQTATLIPKRNNVNGPIRRLIIPGHIYSFAQLYKINDPRVFKNRPTLKDIYVFLVKKGLAVYEVSPYGMDEIESAKKTAGKQGTPVKFGQELYNSIIQVVDEYNKGLLIGPVQEPCTIEQAIINLMVLGHRRHIK